MPAILGFKNIANDTNFSEMDVESGYEVLFEGGFNQENFVGVANPIVFHFSFVMPAVVSGVALISLHTIHNHDATGGYTMTRLQMAMSSFQASPAAVPFFDQYRRTQNENLAMASANAVFVVDPMASTLTRANGGFSASARVYCKMTVESGIAGTKLGGVAIWKGFRAKIKEASYGLGGQDSSGVSWPDAGEPIVDRKARARTLELRFTGMDEKDVWGGTRGVFASDYVNPVCRASVAHINYNNGTSSPVLFVPNSAIQGAPYSDRADSAGRNWNQEIQMQSKHMYGLLTKPLHAQHVALVNEEGGIGHCYEADCGIVEVTGV